MYSEVVNVQNAFVTLGDLCYLLDKLGVRSFSEKRAHSFSHEGVPDHKINKATKRPR